MALFEETQICTQLKDSRSRFSVFACYLGVRGTSQLYISNATLLRTTEAPVRFAPIKFRRVLLPAEQAFLSPRALRDTNHNQSLRIQLSIRGCFSTFRRKGFALVTRRYFLFAFQSAHQTRRKQPCSRAGWEASRQLPVSLTEAGSSSTSCIHPFLAVN